MKFSKKMVALVIVLNVAFAAVVFTLSYYDKTVPPELINWWFRFTAIELLALAVIKVTEVVKTGKEVIADAGTPDAKDGH